MFYNKRSYLTFEQLNRRTFGTTHDDKTTHIKAMKQMAILLQSVSQNLMIVLYLKKIPMLYVLCNGTGHKMWNILVKQTTKNTL